MNSETINKLIELSMIFKSGYTIEIKSGDLNQYRNFDKPFIVSHKTFIKIIDNSILKNCRLKIPSTCVIGEYFDPRDNIYYITLNKVFSSLFSAEKFAIKHEQLFIYNIRNGACIKPRDWR